MGEVFPPRLLQQQLQSTSRYPLWEQVQGWDPVQAGHLATRLVATTVLELMARALVLGMEGMGWATVLRLLLLLMVRALVVF